MIYVFRCRYFDNGINSNLVIVVFGIVALVFAAKGENPNVVNRRMFSMRTATASIFDEVSKAGHGIGAVRCDFDVIGMSLPHPSAPRRLHLRGQAMHLGESPHPRCCVDRGAGSWRSSSAKCLRSSAELGPRPGASRLLLPRVANAYHGQVPEGACPRLQVPLRDAGGVVEVPLRLAVRSEPT